ncbi:hypothetical protein [Kitasatospora sp. NPDC004289]
MTDRTPAQTLRAAAKKLRQQADGVTAGPWTHDPDVVWNAHPHFNREFVGAPAEYGNAIVASTGTPEDPQALVDADWIALMHPGVGTALADWLDSAAEDAEQVGPDHHALAVARQLLAEVAE